MGWIISASILLAAISLLFISVPARLTVSVREDLNWQGVLVSFDARLLRLDRRYDFSDPSLNLLEMAILKAYENRNHSSASSKEQLRPFKTAQRWWGFINPHRTWFVSALALPKIARLEWSSTVGGEDAYRTAMNSGVAWAVKGSLLGWLSSCFAIGELAVKVTPNFSASGYLSTLKCILKIRLVQIIIIKTYLSVKKSGGV